MPKALRFQWPLKALLRAIGLISIASSGVQAIQVSEVFVVPSGTDKGGCDNHNVNQWFQDSIVLADAAMACIDDAIAQKDSGNTNSDSQKYIQTFFNINAKRGTFGGHVQALKKSVQDVIDALKDATTDDDKPWIFCDSTWAEEKTWDSIGLEERTGVQDPDGRTIAELHSTLYELNWVKRKKAIDDAKTQEEKDALDQPFVPFWGDAAGLKKYNFDIPGDYCSRDLNLAGTDDNFQPNTITLCAKNWAGKGWYASLDAIPSVTEEKLSIEHLQPEAVTLFHEMFHFALLIEHTPDIAYRLTEITRKNPTEKTGKQITQEESKKNPETFALFALAYELGRRNPGYTFASSASKRL